jgi:hypothetical protein
MLQALCMACVAGGGQVIALDAHASERAKSDLRRLTGLDPYVVTAPEGARTVWTGLPEFQYPDMEGLLTALLDCADDKDQRGIVYANSQHDVLAIARLLGQRGRSVVAIHANATPADRATLVDVNTEWDKADFVVYNDAAGSGVSFDGTGRHAFALVRHWPGYTWANPMQGVGRCRKPLTLSSWVSDRVQSGSTDRKHIRTQLFKTISSSLDLAYGVNAAGAPVAAPRNNEYFESMVDHEWTLRVRGAHLAQDYYAIREGLYGVVLTQMPPMDETSKKAVARVFSAARDEVKGEIVEEAQSAPHHHRDRGR